MVDGRVKLLQVLV